MCVYICIGAWGGEGVEAKFERARQFLDVFVRVYKRLSPGQFCIFVPVKQVN